MSFLLKYSKFLLALLLLIIAFFLSYLPQFTLDASSESLVLEDDADLLFYNKLREQYVGNEGLIIAYQSKTPLLQQESLAALQQFIDDIHSIPQVVTTTNIFNVPLFQSPPLSLTELAIRDITIANGNADLALAQQEFQTSPIYSNNLVSTDGKTTAILVSTRGNVDTAITRIRAVIAKHTHAATIFLGGVPMITHDIIDYIASDLVIFSIAVIGVMALILLIIFKSLRFMLLPLGVSVITALLMSGIIAFLGWKVTVISANFFSLLLVLTLAVMIHLVVKYRELALLGGTKEELITRTVKQMFRPCLYTTLTTLVAFISLLISGIRPVIDFGFMMSIGVLLALIMAFIVFVLGMQLLPYKPAQAHKQQFAITSIFAQFTHRFPRLLLGLTSVLTIVIIYGLTQVTVENRFIDYFKDSTEINQGLSLIDDKLGGTMELEIIFDELGFDYFYDEEIRADIAQVHKYLEQNPAIGKVLSITTLMDILTTANEGVPLGGFLLNIAKTAISGNAKEQIVTPYINEDSGQLRIVARIKENTPHLERNTLLQTIQTDLVDMGFNKERFHISGMMVLYNNMLQSLFNSQINTLSMVFALIWLMFAVLFKSFKIATLAIIPNILPALAVIGIMGVLHIPLDLMTITIASIAIGIGVDDAIHYIMRFRAELTRTEDYTQAMFNAHSSIGLAMFYTSITIIAGFIIMALSNFIPSIYFGIFTSLAMLLSVVLNLTLLPKLLILFKI